ARRVLAGQMLRRDCTFWAWTAADWFAVCGDSPGAFRRQHGERASRGRHHLLALAYLSGVTDLRSFSLGLGRVPVARAVFGPERIAAAFARLSGVLYGRAGLGYFDQVGKRKRLCSQLALALLLNRSPYPEDLSASFLAGLAGEVSANTAP